MKKTYSPTAKDIDRKWFVVDATGQTLGRLASRIAHVLRGKHKPGFSPHLDMGDHVIVVNADKVAVTGRKEERKVYYRHTGYPGGIRTTSYREMMEKHPERVIAMAVRGMLPRNILGRRTLKKLRVYAGPEHRHEAQKPEELTF
ncbi:MAG: 50S ribosomal protein L13 [Gemmatimonadetes bacterium]|nr:50S ribosomal protein L13 [Gemmatimonadota bacterium]